MLPPMEEGNGYKAHVARPERGRAEGGADLMPVPWEMFCTYSDGAFKFDDAWLLTPENVVSYFANADTYCRLCDSYFEGRAADHVAAHGPSLSAWKGQQRQNGRPVDPDLEEKLATALRLVGEGLSQRQAAAKAGISRQRLQGALQSRADGAREVAHAEIGDSTRPDSGPPPTALPTSVSGTAEDVAA
jgi:predicted DNA-binding protein (UPF0251 family)